VAGSSRHSLGNRRDAKTRRIAPAHRRGGVSYSNSWVGLANDLVDVNDRVPRVTSVDIASGPEENCKSWKQTYRDWRNQSLDKTEDSGGWISPEKGGFVKFVNNDNRLQSRYYSVNCDFFGYCRMTVCRDNLTTSFNFNGTGKSQGFGQPILTQRFGDVIRYAIDELDLLLLDRKADLTYGVDERR
jgi:hypothetical protein